MFGDPEDAPQARPEISAQKSLQLNALDGWNVTEKRDVNPHIALRHVQQAQMAKPDQPKIIKIQGVNREWRGVVGVLELTVLSANSLGLTDATKASVTAVALPGKAGAAAQADAEPAGPAVSKSHLPKPRLHAFLPTETPPRRVECRKTPDVLERTANPIWNCRWNFTVEYTSEDTPPADIRLEVWDVGGRTEFLGEVSVPFPLDACVRQYHAKLEANPSKMHDEWKLVNGDLSFQVRLRPEEHVRDQDLEELLVPPSELRSVSGAFGIEVVRAEGLRSADLMTSDPYCVVHVCTAPRQVKSWTTGVRPGTLNPVWRERHEFQVNWPKVDASSAPPVKVEIWDHDGVSSDEFLGEATFALPLVDGEDTLELEVMPNRLKGPGLAKGRLHVRVYFRNLFKHAHKDKGLSPYEEAFCEFFGTRQVDEQLAREVAPPLVYFHLSARRQLVGHLRASFERATYGLAVGDGNVEGDGGASRSSRYLELTSSLWSALAISTVLLSILPGLGGAFATGVLNAMFLPSPANLIARFCWHGPIAIDTDGDGDADGVLDVAVPQPISVAVLLGSWFILVLFIGFSEAKDVTYLACAAMPLLLLRLLFIPLVRALFLVYVVTSSKRSGTFDLMVWLWPSLLTAFGELIPQPETAAAPVKAQAKDPMGATK